MEQTKIPGFGENWRYYLENSGDPFHICYDATVKQLPEEVRKQYPNTLVLEIPFTETNKDRYPSKVEMERIYDISENVSYDTDHVRMIGIMIGRSCGWISFCCDVTAQKIKKLIRTLLHGSGCTECTYQFSLDDHFAYYNRVLTPPFYEDNWIRNRTLCDGFTVQGEAFKAPREIEFLCCFSDTQHIQHIVEQLKGQGFCEVDVEQAESGEYWLRFTLEGIPSLLWINEITCGIIHLLEGTDGYFDGWGCLVVKDDDA